ncbi:MAG: SRPBCC domain-containing protein [Kangiellaceae bacterium]|nr:SRPBCC domain-containing protein [Kangiellaceae bacterium]
MNQSNEIKVEPTILTREYNAPRQLVFEAWTKAEHLCQWQFPFKGFKCEFADDNIVAGGETLHKMIAPNGFEMWLLTKYEEITPPHRLIFRQYTSNESGDILPNPQMPVWPKEMRTTINLEEVGNVTKLELIWQPIDPTEEEAKIFDASRSEHEKGWGGGLEQLGEYLNNM